MANQSQKELRDRLFKGHVIPAHPLALTSERALDERRQRALTRYYCAAGAGGVAVGVHTTQFAIRDPKHDLLRPVLMIAAETIREFEHKEKNRLLKIGGICGDTRQAMNEAKLLAKLGYDVGLLSLSALKQTDVDTLIDHCRAVAEVIPIMGFYLQAAAGGRVLPIAFWRRFAEIENVVAIKIAPFNRYQTLDVIRSVIEVGRSNEIALYTGNDDTIVIDLLTIFRLLANQRIERVRIVGGLLGHWACWTRRAVALLRECQAIAEERRDIPAEMLTRAVEVTDANAAFFDAANNFSGCIAGIHEVLVRQGLLAGRWCLDPNEDVSPGQLEEIDRVYAAYPHLNDDAFVLQHLDEWLR